MSTVVLSIGNFDQFLTPSLLIADVVYERSQRLMMEEVGCTVPWIPDKSQICTDEIKRKKAFDVYQQNRRNQKVTSQWGQTLSKVAFE